MKLLTQMRLDERRNKNEREQKQNIELNKKTIVIERHIFYCAIGLQQLFSISFIFVVPKIRTHIYRHGHRVLFMYPQMSQAKGRWITDQISTWFNFFFFCHSYKNHFLVIFFFFLFFFNTWMG